MSTDKIGVFRQLLPSFEVAIVRHFFSSPFLLLPRRPHRKNPVRFTPIYIHASFDVPFGIDGICSVSLSVRDVGRSAGNFFLCAWVFGDFFSLCVGFW